MQYNQLIEKESGGSISQGITFFEYLCVFVLSIYAGRANKYVEPFTFQDNLLLQPSPLHPMDQSFLSKSKPGP